MILTETRRKLSVWLVALWTCLMVGITPVMHAQSHDAFVKWASPRIIPIQTFELRSDVNDLVPLRKLIGDSRVVALGEPTHGAHEPLEFRNRLIKFLVERLGFTAVALETGFTEADSVDAYIQGGPGACKAVTSNNMSWGFGHFEENQELVQWLRSYNLNRAHPHKVHFYGMDLTGGDNGEFPNARRSIDDAVKTLQRVDSATASRLSARFAPYLTRFSTEGYSSFTAADKTELESLLNELRTAVTQKKPALLANVGQEGYERVQRDIVVAQQLNHMFAISPPPSRGIPADGDAMVSARNKAMADNVRWLLEQEGPKGRILVFAHNMHVMNSTLQGGPWAKFRHPSSSTGQFLRSALGSDLVIIGGAAASTAGSLPPMEKNPASFDDALSELAAPQFLLDLRASADNTAVSKWLSGPMPMHANIFDHMIVSPRPAFDAVYFIDPLTIARVPE